MNAHERKPVASVFIYLILSTHPIQLSAAAATCKSQMNSLPPHDSEDVTSLIQQQLQQKRLSSTAAEVEESQKAGGGGAFDQGTIAHLENQFEELFKGLQVMKERIEDMNAEYESSEDAKHTSFKGAPWHLATCGHANLVSYKVKTLKQKEALLGLALNETDGGHCNHEKEECEVASGCQWKPGRVYGGDCVEAVECGPCTTCSVSAGGKTRTTFYKENCEKATICEWTDGSLMGGTCELGNCDKLKNEGLKLAKEFDTYAGDAHKDFDKDKPPASKKGQMDKNAITKNVGNAKLFQSVVKLQQNAEEGQCDWYLNPKKGDPDFSAIEKLMGQEDKQKQIKEVMKDKDPKDHQKQVQGAINIFAAGLPPKALEIQKPADDKFANEKGQDEGKDDRALTDAEQFKKGKETTPPKQEIGKLEGEVKDLQKRVEALEKHQPSAPSGSSQKPAKQETKTAAKPAKKKSFFSGWRALMQTSKNSSYTGELVSSSSQMVTSDGFAFCLIPFLGWGFCTMVAFTILTYMFVMFWACIYAIMIFMLPLMGLIWCGMLAFVHFLYRMFKTMLVGEYQPDTIGVLDKCMPFFTWPLANAPDGKWVALMTCAFGAMVR